jgi:hypothetical protein
LACQEDEYVDELTRITGDTWRRVNKRGTRMEPLETLALEIASIERQLSRRTFLKLAALAAVPHPALDKGDLNFLRGVAATLISPEALARTGIDVLANIDHLLVRGSAEHRAKVMRLVAWARRISFIYGGENVAIRTRTSRFVLVQRMGKALSSLCLVAFWADERALQLIAVPGEI